MAWKIIVAIAVGSALVIGGVGGSIAYVYRSSAYTPLDSAQSGTEALFGGPRLRSEGGSARWATTPPLVGVRIGT